MSASKSKMGQPTKYDERYCQEILEYFGAAPYIEVERDIVTKTGDVAKVMVREAGDFPSFAGFASKIRIHRCTLYEWQALYPDFKEACLIAKEFQENWLLTNGMRGLIQPTPFVFVLKNASGYRDKQPGEDNQVIEHKGETKTVVTMDIQDRVKLLKNAK